MEANNKVSFHKLIVGIALWLSPIFILELSGCRNANSNPPPEETQNSGDATKDFSKRAAGRFEDGIGDYVEVDAKARHLRIYFSPATLGFNQVTNVNKCKKDDYDCVCTFDGCADVKLLEGKCTLEISGTFSRLLGNKSGRVLLFWTIEKSDLRYSDPVVEKTVPRSDVDKQNNNEKFKQACLDIAAKYPVGAHEDWISYDDDKFALEYDLGSNVFERRK